MDHPHLIAVEIDGYWAPCFKGMRYDADRTIPSPSALLGNHRYLTLRPHGMAQNHRLGRISLFPFEGLGLAVAVRLDFTRSHPPTSSATLEVESEKRHWIWTSEGQGK